MQAETKDRRVCFCCNRPAYLIDHPRVGARQLPARVRKLMSWYRHAS